MDLARKHGVIGAVFIDVLLHLKEGEGYEFKLLVEGAGVDRHNKAESNELCLAWMSVFVQTAAGN
jgi:hypothetical protein